MHDKMSKEEKVSCHNSTNVQRKSIVKLSYKKNSCMKTVILIIELLTGILRTVYSKKF